MDFEREGFLGVESDSIMKLTLEVYAPWFSLAYDVNRLVNKQKEALGVTTDQTKEVVLTALYTKISNHYQSVIILLQKGLSVEADIIVRSMLESLIPLKLIVTEEDFFAEFIRNDKASKYRLYNVMSDKQNVDLFNLTEDNLRQRDELKMELSPFYKNGVIKTFSVEELARRANMNMDYQLAYRYLSGYVHSSLDTFVYGILKVPEIAA